VASRWRMRLLKNRSLKLLCKWRVAIIKVTSPNLFKTLQVNVLKVNKWVELNQTSKQIQIMVDMATSI